LSITARAPPRGYPGTRSFILGIVPLIFSNAAVFNTAVFNTAVFNTAVSKTTVFKTTVFNTTVFNAIATVFNQVL